MSPLHQQAPIRPPLRPTLVAPTAAPSVWEAVVDVLRKHYHEPDTLAARVVYSAVAAHRLSGQLVWPMLIGPPGSLKTELLYGLEGFPKVEFIDKVTSQTFISGYFDDHKPRGKTPPSLLHRIGSDGMIVCPDFSTILAIHGDHRASIFADFRRIYDGQLRKEFGTAQDLGQREWRGRITFLAAGTDDVDRHYAVFQSLGERFVMVRWPRPDGIPAAMRAMNQNNPEARVELQAAVHKLLPAGPPTDEPSVPEAIQRQIAALADFTARGRTRVHRDGYRKEIEHVPEPESSTRLAQQMAQLVKGSAVLDRRGAVNADDYALAVRVAFDSLPPARRKVIDAIIAGNLADAKLPPSTKSYAIEDLAALELVVADKQDLSALARDLLAKAGIL